jgi:L-malate glycosyltransferase
MKICLVSPIYPAVGGIASWANLYKKKISELNHDLTIINTSLIGRRSSKINAKRNFLIEFYRYLKILINLLKYDKKIFDIHHFNTSASNFGIIRDYLLIKHLYKVKTKIILHFHCNIKDQITRKIGKSFLKKSLNLVDYTIVLNDQSKDYLLDLGYRNVIYIPNFIDHEFYQNTKFEIKKEISEIVFVGHVIESKGVKEIFEVSKRFKKIIFNIIGPYNYNKNIKFSENVIFHGILRSEKLKEVILKSDVFLFPSYTEGFSISLLEAMSLGLSIITTDVGSNKKLINKKGGIIVPIKNVDKIEEAILSLKNDKKRYAMGQYNINEVKRYYNDDVVITKLVNFYHNILNSNENLIDGN